MSNLKSFLALASIAALFLAGCVTADEHQKSLPSTQEREMTVGVVQKEIKVGMSQTEVVEALGSPNIITRDKQGKESWVYDKIATEASYSKSSTSAGGFFGGAGNSLILGGVSVGTSRDTGAVSSTQKTLTVIIKYDTQQLVEAFSYHASKF